MSSRSQLRRMKWRERHGRAAKQAEEIEKRAAEAERSRAESANGGTENMTKYRKLMRGQHVEERWLLTVANGRALGLPLLGWLALLVGIGTATLMPGCATVQSAATAPAIAPPDDLHAEAQELRRDGTLAEAKYDGQHVEDHDDREDVPPAKLLPIQQSPAPAKRQTPKQCGEICGACSTAARECDADIRAGRGWSTPACERQTRKCGALAALQTETGCKCPDSEEEE